MDALTYQLTPSVPQAPKPAQNLALVCPVAARLLPVRHLCKAISQHSADSTASETASSTATLRCRNSQARARYRKSFRQDLVTKVAQTGPRGAGPSHQAELAQFSYRQSTSEVGMPSPSILTDIGMPTPRHACNVDQSPGNFLPSRHRSPPDRKSAEELPESRDDRVFIVPGSPLFGLSVRDFNDRETEHPDAESITVDMDAACQNSVGGPLTLPPLSATTPSFGRS